ncbi:unnamed protein product [Calypogeia fissa]
MYLMANKSGSSFWVLELLLEGRRHYHQAVGPPPPTILEEDFVCTCSVMGDFFLDQLWGRSCLGGAAGAAASTTTVLLLLTPFQARKVPREAHTSPALQRSAVQGGLEEVQQQRLLASNQRTIWWFVCTSNKSTYTVLLVS